MGRRSRGRSLGTLALETGDRVPRHTRASTSSSRTVSLLQLMREAQIGSGVAAIPSQGAGLLERGRDIALGSGYRSNQ